LAQERERRGESASGVKGRRKAAAKAVQCFLLYFSTSCKKRRRIRKKVAYMKILLTKGASRK